MCVVSLCLVFVTSVSSAPSARRERRSTSDLDDPLVHAVLQDGTKAEASDLATRERRHAHDGEIVADEDNDILHLANGAEIDLSHLSRHRRSAVFLLSATLRLCQEEISLCRRIEISEGQAKVVLQLTDS